MKTVIAAGAVCALAGGASAQTIDFSELSHGDVVTDQYDGLGVNISAINPNRPFDIAMAFDTTLEGTADPDLEDEFSMGNLPLDTILGNVLIIARDETTPNDEGSRPAGQLIFDFDVIHTGFGFDVVDLEDITAENSSLDFYNGDTLVWSVEFEEFEDGGAYDADAIFGNNSINRIEQIFVDDGFDQVVINVGGSMGFDNISFTVPAPGALVLLGFGASLSGRRRRV